MGTKKLNAWWKQQGGEVLEVLRTKNGRTPSLDRVVGEGKVQEISISTQPLKEPNCFRSRSRPIQRRNFGKHNIGILLLISELEAILGYLPAPTESRKP
jgi:hypothetical protein